MVSSLPGDAARRLRRRLRPRRPRTARRATSGSPTPAGGARRRGDRATRSRCCAGGGRPRSTAVLGPMHRPGVLRVRPRGPRARRGPLGQSVVRRPRARARRRSTFVPACSPPSSSPASAPSPSSAAAPRASRRWYSWRARRRRRSPRARRDGPAIGERDDRSLAAWALEPCASASPPPGATSTGCASWRSPRASGPRRSEARSGRRARGRRRELRRRARPQARRRSPESEPPLALPRRRPAQQGRPARPARRLLAGRRPPRRGGGDRRPPARCPPARRGRDDRASTGGAGWRRERCRRSSRRCGPPGARSTGS